jgi:hypothetical protein
MRRGGNIVERCAGKLRGEGNESDRKIAEDRERIVRIVVVGRYGGEE